MLIRRLSAFERVCSLTNLSPSANNDGATMERIERVGKNVKDKEKKGMEQNDKEKVEKR